MSESNKERVKSWLDSILFGANYGNFSINIVGNSEKGDGYLSDIVFVEVITLSPKQTLNLVIKQSKTDKAIRKSSPVKNMFLNEIHMYETVLPTLEKYQREKGIAEPFNSVPKFYGKYTEDELEVMALENLKPKGYELWDKKKPLARNYLQAVVDQYAKFHASATALKFQNPELFERLANGIQKSFMAFEMKDLDVMFGSKIEKACELLQNEMENNILQKWKTFRSELITLFNFSYADNGQLRVFTHGDCWINNFLFKYNEHNSAVPEISFLDLQMSNVASPILDLSYFLFSAISSTDLDDLNQILKQYYETFSNHLEQLGSDASVMYSYHQFLADWKKYCKYGLAIVPVCYYVCSTDKNEIPDSDQHLNENFGAIFTYDIQDASIFKERVASLMKYSVKNNLL